MAKNNNSEIKSAVKSANLVATQTASVSAGVGAAMAEIEANSVSGLAASLSALTAGLAAMREDAARRDAENAIERAALLAKLNAPKVRTVKVAADGTQVVSSGKRGKPPTAGLDDCRDKEGKVVKVGLRAYANETSGIRTGTYRLASRGTHGPGLGECISKVAACPYTPKQLAIINSASEFLDFGLRFSLVAVTPSTVKMVPARHLTEIEAEGATVVASLLSSVGLDIDAWTKLRTTVDATAEGEINSAETTDADFDDDGEDFGA